VLKTIYNNFIIGFFSSIFAALTILIVTGVNWGYNGFWFNTILFTIIFTIVDLIKKPKVKEVE
jgi:hypothetical protein